MESIGSDVYQAERILDHKKIRGKRHFLIKWFGWDKSNNTWEPERNIIDKQLIELYYKSLKRKSHPQTSSAATITPSKSVKTRQDANNEGLLEDSKPAESENKEKNKVNNNNSETALSIKTNDLRSAKRIAEGLRPIKTNDQNLKVEVEEMRQLSLKSNNSINNNTKSSSSSSLNLSNTGSNVNESSSNENLITKTSLRRRKLSNLSLSSSSTITNRTSSTTATDSSSSLSRSYRNKKRTRLINNRKNERKQIKDDSQDEQREEAVAATDDQERNNENILNSNNDTGVANQKRISQYSYNDQQFSSSSEDEDDNYDTATVTSGSDSISTYLTNNHCEDIFITDVTSGVVTVTIKESMSPNGFFKKRDL